MRAVRLMVLIQSRRSIRSISCQQGSGKGVEASLTFTIESNM